MNNNLSVLQLCNRHLIEFFHAVEHEDMKSILKIEHELTPEEACVACSYSLRAPKKVKQLLNDHFKKQGLTFSGEKKESGASTIKYIILRVLLFTLLLFIIWQWGLIAKKLLIGISYMNSFGFFGWVGAVILAVSIFTLFEFNFLED